MSQIVYGAPTSVDWASAYAYASDQVNRLKCTDPSILQDKTVCPDGKGDCLKWIENDGLRVWNKPALYTDISCNSKTQCTQGQDCIKNPQTGDNVCGYAPPDAQSGRCHFMTPDSCLNAGQLPYTCDSNGNCQYLPQKDIVKGYAEWRSSATGPISGTSGKCVLGNFVLKQWCENPRSRCVANSDGTYPSICVGGKDTPGVVDVPPFFYNSDTGICHMTKPYCDYFDVDYNKNACATSNDCNKGDSCEKGYCTGPGSSCYVPKGQEIGEDWFVGKTIFRLFKSGGCQNKEAFKYLFDKFNKSPNIALQFADDNYIEEKQVITPNFAGNGINLYLITWKKNTQGFPNIKHKRINGFSSEEVGNRFPEFITIVDSKKYIKIEKKDLYKYKGDINTYNNVKRIFMTINSADWMFDNIKETMQKTK